MPTKKWTYDESQLQQIAELKEYTRTLLLPETDSYHPWELRFLSDPGTHPRYMRAAKWKMEDAKKRIKGTIDWRREFKPELIEPGDVGVEAETGKIILGGFDRDVRPIIYMRPGRENTETSPRQIRHLIYNLERAIDLMPPGQEQVCIIIDYKSATSQSNPSVSTGLKVLGILQNHYVERLGRGLVINMSWLVNAFFSGISPFMDPITRDKIRFNPKLTELVEPSQLDAEFGGDYNFEYDYSVYWPQLTEFCHIAENGTRVNDKGETCIPPSGNGIKAAIDGLLPRKDAVTTGDTTTNPDDASLPNGAATLAAVGASGEGAVKANDESAASKNGKEGGLEGLEEKTAGLAVSSANGTGESATESEVPAVTVKPGAPEGDLIFDHPPTEAEKIVARNSLEKRQD